MANHKAEQVLSAVTTLLTNLATTGSNVERGRFYPFKETVTAALTITQGQLDLVETKNNSFQDVTLEVIVTAHAKGADGTVESTINQIAKEVYVAMMVDYTLGLGFVQDTIWQGNDEPALGRLEKSVVSMDMRFTVKFRHNYLNPAL